MGSIDQRLPLYQRLRDDIAAQIASHVWRPGEAIPTEAELAASYGVAVGTVRKAIQTLVDEGLVERFQGRGTFVRRPSFDSSLFRFLRFQGPDGRHEVPESRILDRSAATASGAAAKALRLPAGAPVIRMLRQRLIAGRPVLAEEIWLPRGRFEPVLTSSLDELGALLYPAYERLCGEIVASAEETLTVEELASPFDGLLSLPPGSPVVVIERLAFGYHGGPLEWRRSCAPASTFRYHVEIR